MDIIYIVCYILDFFNRDYNPKDRVNPNAQLDPKTGKSLEYNKLKTSTINKSDYKSITTKSQYLNNHKIRTSCRHTSNRRN